MMQNPRESAQAKLIEDLGGATEIAKLLLATFPKLREGDDEESTCRKIRDRIYKWQADGSIPHRWRPYMRRVAIDQGKPVPEELRDPAEAA